jgi:hypothetical protein
LQALQRDLLVPVTARPRPGALPRRPATSPPKARRSVVSIRGAESHFTVRANLRARPRTRTAGSGSPDGAGGIGYEATPNWQLHEESSTYRSATKRFQGFPYLRRAQSPEPAYEMSTLSSFSRPGNPAPPQRSRRCSLRELTVRNGVSLHVPKSHTSTLGPGQYYTHLPALSPRDVRPTQSRAKNQVIFAQAPMHKLPGRMFLAKRAGDKAAQAHAAEVRAQKEEIAGLEAWFEAQIATPSS